MIPNSLLILQKQSLRVQKIGEGSDDIIEGGDTSKCLIHRWLLILRKILMPKLTNERKKEKMAKFDSKSF